MFLSVAYGYALYDWRKMKNFVKRLIQLIIGLYCFGLGIVFTIYANVGLASWDLFHQSLVPYVHVTLGQVSIIVGFIILIINYFFGEKIGVGTILNMLLVGIFLDFNIKVVEMLGIHKNTNLLIGLAMMLFGLFIIAFGSYLYLSSEFGVGPRDGLMVIIRKRTKLPVGFSRILVEGTVIVIGLALGGKFGLGTIFSAFAISFCVQTVFSLMRFEVSIVEHQTLRESWLELIAHTKKNKI